MTDKPNISLSVFFPCYNEQGNIERVIRQALEVLPAISNDYEIIMVDDGSQDDTGAIIDRLAAEHPNVRAIHHDVNEGYGGALQSGFAAAAKDWVFYTDGDGQFDLHELPGLLDMIDDYDIISCYRLNRQDNWIRRLNAWAWGQLVNVLFGMRVRDVDCAFKLYRRDLFDHIPMHSRGALIDAEILARAQRAGFRIGQRGVQHYPRQAGQQSGANLKVIARAFVELLKLRRRIKRGD